MRSSAECSRRTDRPLASERQVLLQLPGRRMWDCQAASLVFCERRGRSWRAPKSACAPSRLAPHRIVIGAQLCDDEGHPWGHQAGKERHVARKTIELGQAPDTSPGALWPMLRRAVACGRAHWRLPRFRPRFGFAAPQGVPEQVAIRIKVLEDICAAPESKAHSPEREALADLIVSLFWDGNRTPRNCARHHSDERLRVTARRHQSATRFGTIRCL